MARVLRRDVCVVRFNDVRALHANDAGYEAMANAINLDLFRSPRERTSTRMRRERSR
jgi:hypothetical protein